MRSNPRRAGISLAPVLIFLAGFALIISAATFYYLIPALRAASATTHPADRKQLAAQGSVVLVIVVFSLLALLVVSLRIGRLMSRSARPRVHTDYPDAWEESARRLMPEDADEAGEEEDEQPGR